MNIFAKNLSLNFMKRLNWHVFCRIFKEFGNPSEANWPGYSELPLVKNLSFVDYKSNVLRRRFPQTVLTNSGYDLLSKLLEYNPKARVTAARALEHIVSLFSIPQWANGHVFPPLLYSWKFCTLD